eukprot:6491569-Amphidinium_carterae.3
MPQQWAITQEGAGTQKFRTASGEELTDAGGIRLKGKAVGTSSLDMRMRLTEVRTQTTCFRTQVSRDRRRLVSPRDCTRPETRELPLYQETGVYNLYVKPSADLSSIETASAVGVGLSGNQAAGAARAALSVTETASVVSAGLRNQRISGATSMEAANGEPAIVALKNQVRAAAKDVEIIPQESPVGDHKAAGAAENAVKRVKGLARTRARSELARKARVQTSSQTPLALLDPGLRRNLPQPIQCRG